MDLLRSCLTQHKNTQTQLTLCISNESLFVFECHFTMLLKFCTFLFLFGCFSTSDALFFFSIRKTKHVFMRIMFFSLSQKSFMFSDRKTVENSVVQLSARRFGCFLFNFFDIQQNIEFQHVTYAINSQLLRCCNCFARMCNYTLYMNGLMICLQCFLLS